MRWKILEECSVIDRLKEKAAAPYDLTAPGALTGHGRMEAMVCQGGPLNLLYATQRIDREVLALLQEVARECGLVQQFREMRRGAVLNKIEGFDSENRQVLHTAVRDIFSESPAEPVATAQAKAELDKLKEFLQELDDGSLCNERGEKFDTFIHIGIGGSDLGPRAVYESLKSWGTKDKKIHFVSNVDPDDAASVLNRSDLSRSLINIVSKSGTTLETLTNEQLVCHVLRSQGLDPAKHCIAVTGSGSPMDDPQKYLRTFYMYDYIGGRYSVSSMVGAVVLGFSLGYEQFVQFLQGAAEMDVLAEREDVVNNLPLMLALLGIWNHNLLGYPTVAVLPYSQALHRFPAHLQQCDMESNGKTVLKNGERCRLKTGPIVWGEPGTNGQHAFYQLLHQGTEVVPAEFIGFIKSQYDTDLQVEGTSSQQKLLANLFAQSVALAQGEINANPNKNFDGNRPSSMIIGEQLTPFTMGALLAAYEAKIVFQGFCWGINSFDQEGVQLGKVLAGRFIEVFKGKGDKDGLEEKMIMLARKVKEKGL